MVEKLVRRRRGVVDTHGKEALTVINVLGDAVHNFIAGVLIGARYLASPGLGVATTLAVLLHEIPQELSDFAILVQSGAGVRRAVWLNLAAASTAILGMGVALLVGTAFGQAVLHLLLPVTAGGSSASRRTARIARCSAGGYPVRCRLHVVAEKVT